MARCDRDVFNSGRSRCSGLLRRAGRVWQGHEGGGSSRGGQGREDSRRFCLASWGRVWQGYSVLYLTLLWIGCAGRVGFGRDMRAVAALEEGKGEKTAVDFASLAGAEGENYMQDPLRAYKIWRAVCVSSLGPFLSVC
jgi:hypothetical protein